MSIENLVRTLMEEFKVIVRAETVVGEPIEVDNTTIIPVSKITFGFGAGGGARKTSGKADEAQPDSGQGIGGGGGIEPVAFIVVRDDKIKLMSLAAKEVTLGKVIDLVPEILSRIKRKSDSPESHDKGEAAGGSGANEDNPDREK